MKVLGYVKKGVPHQIKKKGRKVDFSLNGGHLS